LSILVIDTQGNLKLNKGNSLKDIVVGDIVKFVPYYASKGMQGANLKLQMPKYKCLGLVCKTYVIRGIGHADLMLPNRVKKLVAFAGIEMVCRIK